MILWCDGGHSAPENMRRDQRLLARLDAACDGTPAAAPVLRLFRFAPPGITLGRSQDPERTLDLDRCRADRVEWAVRPTGGRAIYHDAEWTYSLAARITDLEWGGSLGEAFGRVSRLVHASLVRLGVPAELAATRGVNSNGRASPAGGPPNDPARATCFAATARHEIELSGRKLVGSAQRRTAGAFLQQGSVLLGDGHLRLAEYLALSRSARERARATLAAATRSGGGHLGSRQQLERWAEALVGVLGPRVRTLSGEAGVFLMTLGETTAYTAASPHTDGSPH